MNGYVVYEGPSLLDGAPIVAIVTGLGARSQNSKTGDMPQVWILRAGVDPCTAMRRLSPPPQGHRPAGAELREPLVLR